MKNYVIFCILIGVVAGRDVFERLFDHVSEAVDTLTSHWKDITKSLPDDKQFGDFSRYLPTVKLAKREANESDSEQTVVSFLSGEFSQKCSVNFDEISGTLDQCTDQVLETIIEEANKTDDSSDVMPKIKSACRHAAELKECFTNFTNDLLPCLPTYHGKSVPIAEVIQNLINLTCIEEGSLARVHSFLTDGVACIKSRKLELTECKNTYYPPESEIDLDGDSFILTEESCKNYPAMEKCFKDELLKCAEPAKAIDFIESGIRAIKEFYWPCENSKDIAK